MDSLALRRRLVRRLERTGAIESARVRDAFLAVPRERFLPEVAARDGLEAVYRDEAILTRRDALGRPTSSSSQPTMMALMLEALRLDPGRRVLEIGTGTGYNAALLATIVGPAGAVVSVELDAELARRATAALEGHRVRVAAGDGRAGWPDGAPYDRVVVTAGTAVVAPAWHEQLVEGGLLVVPLTVGAGSTQVIPALRRDGPLLRSEGVLWGGFVPLRTSADAPLEPEQSLALATGRGSTRLACAGLEPAALERLQALVTDTAPTLRSARVRRLRPALRLFLALETPMGRAVSGAPGAGVATADGSGLALVAENGVGRASLVSWGADEAADELERLLGRWRALGEPDESRLADALELVVEPGAPPRHVWR